MQCVDGKNGVAVSAVLEAVAMAVVAVAVVFMLVWLYARTRGGTDIKALIRSRRRR